MEQLARLISKLTHCCTIMSINKTVTALVMMTTLWPAASVPSIFDIMHPFKKLYF